MKYTIVTDDANADESPHQPGVYKPGDRIHSADVGPDIMEEAKLPADRLLAELGFFPAPADALRADLFATRAAVKGGRATIADIELKLATLPIGGDPSTIRTHEHYRRRARAELVVAEQKLTGLIESLRGYGEEHTVG